MLQPGLSPLPGTLTLQPPGQSVAEVAHGVHRYHAYGHSGSMSQVDSTTAPTTSNYGVAYPTGTTIPVRGDFDTLDNPFYYASDPAGCQGGPHASWSRDFCQARRSRGQRL